MLSPRREFPRDAPSLRDTDGLLPRHQFTLRSASSAQGYPGPGAPEPHAAISTREGAVRRAGFAAGIPAAGCPVPSPVHSRRPDVAAPGAGHRAGAARGGATLRPPRDRIGPPCRSERGRQVDRCQIACQERPGTTGERAGRRPRATGSAPAVDLGVRAGRRGSGGRVGLYGAHPAFHEDGDEDANRAAAKVVEGRSDLGLDGLGREPPRVGRFEPVSDHLEVGLFVALGAHDHPAGVRPESPNILEPPSWPMAT
jgi:hypothetical protein